ncbi:Transcription factor [Penicillium verhagenii]|nr:Transcription factor [Penicillium verhagenii]
MLARFVAAAYAAIGNISASIIHRPSQGSHGQQQPSIILYHSHHGRSINAREEPRGKSTPVPPPTESTELSTILDDWCQKKPTVQTPGFLGHTSYSDAFRDSDSGLELGSLSPSPETFAMNIENVQRGSRVLILLKHLPLYREMLVARYKVWSGWTIGRPITLMILSQTEEMWNSVQCDEADETKQTLLLSKRLFEKQTQPINLHSETTWIEFVSSVTGRWETLGLLFTLIGLAADSTPRDSDDKYHELDGLEGIGQTAVKVGDLCLQFCENAGIVNDIVCSLLLHHVCLLTAVYGDGSHRAWRKLGDLATTLFAFGLHQESVNLPFFLEEIRHRTMIAAYAVDKSGATFLGRPPLISRQYCDLPMPLDLSWDEVLAEPAAREAAIANLTVDGWNKEGSFQNGAMGRICLLASIFREKALELSLGRVTEDLPTRVEALSQELHQQYEDLPDYLHWDFIGHSSDDRLRIDIRLEYIYIDFLLYRNLFKRMKISPDRIVSVSLEIMTVLLSLVARTLEIPTARRNVSWNLCNAGLPSAGVLSAELLRQSRLRIPESSVFSRSEIIQKLSIFASYLETMVQHDDGNHRIAQQGQRAIRHVLDQILSAPIQAVPSMYDSTIGLEIGESGPVLMNSDLLEGIDVDDRGPFLEWLEGTTDFNEPWLAWMNLS